MYYSFATAAGKKLLIVDDNMINLMVEQALLSPLQLDITTAQSGEEALGILEKEKFDLVFMDHFMPGMDGDEVTRIVRSDENNINHDVPIVALTADAVIGVKEKMLENGMNDFLSKPVEMKDAIRVLKRFL